MKKNRKFVNNFKGSVSIEFIVIVPFLIILLFIIISLSQAYYENRLVQQKAVGINQLVRYFLNYNFRQVTDRNGILRDFVDLDLRDDPATRNGRGRAEAIDYILKSYLKGNIPAELKVTICTSTLRKTNDTAGGCVSESLPNWEYPPKSPQSPKCSNDDDIKAYQKALGVTADADGSITTCRNQSNNTAVEIGQNVSVIMTVVTYQRRFISGIPFTSFISGALNSPVRFRYGF